MERLGRNTNESKPDPFKSVHNFNRLALKILTFGMSGETFLGKAGAKQAMLYVFYHSATSLFGLYELLTSFWLSESFLDLMSHWYVALYTWCSAFQFTYLCGIFEEISQENSGNEHFRTTQIVPEHAKRFLNDNLGGFKRFLIFYEAVLIGTCVTYVLGAFIEVGVQLTTTGTVEQMFILSYYSSVPLWGQAIVFIINLFTTMFMITTVTSVFMVTGIRALKIKTQSQIINAALAEENVDIRCCIQDHIELLKLAKRTLNIFRVLNNFMFFTMYLSMAIQLFSLSLIEPTGSYFFSMGADLAACLIILHSQSWFSASITLSLESIAVGAYFSPWYGKNRNFANNVIMIMRMAQRPLNQNLWLNTLRLERATSLRILQSSYSFYTILMVIQEKK